MKLRIRLYKYHDPELVQIYRLESVDFAQLATECLHAFARNDFYKYQIKMEGPCRPMKRVYQLSLKLTPEQDREVLDMLKKVDHGCLNGFIKTILKWYLADPIPAVLTSNETNAVFFKEKYRTYFKELPVVRYTGSSKIETKRQNTPKTQKKAEPTENSSIEEPAGQEMDKRQERGTADISSEPAQAISPTVSPIIESSTIDSPTEEGKTDDSTKVRESESTATSNVQPRTVPAFLPISSSNTYHDENSDGFFDKEEKDRGEDRGELEEDFDLADMFLQMTGG